MPEITEIKGVGPVLAKACVGNGYGSVEEIAAAMVGELVAVPGVSEIRAKQLIGAAQTLLNGGSPASAVPSADAKPEAEAFLAKMNGSKKKNKPKKKDKKNKKKNKKKSKKSKKKSAKKK